MKILLHLLVCQFWEITQFFKMNSNFRLLNSFIKRWRRCRDFIFKILNLKQSSYVVQFWLGLLIKLSQASNIELTEKIFTVIRPLINIFILLHFLLLQFNLFLSQRFPRILLGQSIHEIDFELFHKVFSLLMGFGFFYCLYCIRGSKFSCFIYLVWQFYLRVTLLLYLLPALVLK